MYLAVLPEFNEEVTTLPLDGFFKDLHLGAVTLKLTKSFKSYSIILI